MPKVVFNPGSIEVNVPAGSLVQEAARKAGVEIGIPCGGQGRCGRCAVIIESGSVRRRSTMRLSAADVQAGYALACQTSVDGDAVITVPPQEKLERRLASDRSAAQVALPFPYDYARDQTVRTFYVRVDPPSYADNTDDLARLARALAAQHGIQNVRATLGTLRHLSQDLRTAGWDVTAVIEMSTWPATSRRRGERRLTLARPATSSTW
jgi:uncharacterized 2Fe-2S/4Fe-4S cluster protein (DUF4445 family)